MSESPNGAATAEERMTVAAARQVKDRQVLLVGVGPPNAAANLARRLQAPDAVLIYESGTLDTRPEELPLHEDVLDRERVGASRGVLGFGGIPHDEIGD